MDFSSLHNQREANILQSIKDSKVIRLIKDRPTVKNVQYCLGYYGVIYLEKNVCKFSIKTNCDGYTNIAMRNDFPIFDKKSIDEFIEVLLRYAAKITEDYLKIKSTFYINRINHLNEIYLKKPFTKIYYRMININLDNKYTVFLESGEVVYYNEIDHLLQSFHLDDARRTTFYNVLKKMRIL